MMILLFTALFIENQKSPKNMQIFINISVTLILLLWPLLVMMSPMMLGSPGAVNNSGAVISVTLFLSYPVGVFLVLSVFSIPYFDVSSLKLALGSLVVIAAVFFLFGYHKLLVNTLRGIANSGYSVVENKVYYDGNFIDVADSKTFTPLDAESRISGQDYAWDESHLYYQGKMVDDALPEAIRLVGNNSVGYFRNSQQVIYSGRVLVKAVADRFALFDGVQGWAYSDNEDGMAVYSHGVLLENADGASFKPLNDYYAKDNDRIFKRDQIILSEADAAHFELIEGGHFGRDGHRVYYLETQPPSAIIDADPNSFELLERGYARDSKHIYLIKQYKNVSALTEVDASSFIVTRYDEATRSEASDAHHYYYDGKIVGNKAGADSRPAAMSGDSR